MWKWMFINKLNEAEEAKHDIWWVQGVCSDVEVNVNHLWCASSFHVCYLAASSSAVITYCSVSDQFRLTPMSQIHSSLDFLHLHFLFQARTMFTAFLTPSWTSHNQNNPEPFLFISANPLSCCLSVLTVFVCGCVSALQRVRCDSDTLTFPKWAYFPSLPLLLIVQSPSPAASPLP